MALDHVQARKDAAEGFKLKFFREPTLPEVQMLQAIGALETGYGTGWKGAGKGSFNMGAITAGNSWTGDVFVYKDSYPDDQGVNHWYETRFRKYPNAVEGWKDLANIMYEDRPSVLSAASAGDSYGVSAALYETVYYRGFGKSAQERITNHHNALTRNLIAICRALEEPLPDGSDVPFQTLKRGSAGPMVAELQRLLGLVADGAFGPLTENAVREFQDDNALKVDGVVGPATWAKLREVKTEQPEPEEPNVLVERLRQEAVKLRTGLSQFLEATEPEEG
jgi:peptidoglycan hydrolase-like protein with peptidoglycan-binding domain